MGRPKEELGELRHRIAAHIGTVAPRENAVLKRLLRVVDLALSKKELSPRTITREMVKFLRYWADKEPKTVKVQRMVVGGMSALAASLQGDPFGVSLRREMFERGRSLLGRFPGDPKVYFLFGHMVFYHDGDTMKGLKALKHCLRLKPKHQGCRKIHGWLSQRALRPRCGGADLYPDLGIFVGSLRKKAGARPIAHKGETIYLEPKPILTTSMIAGAEQDKAWTILKVDKPESHRAVDRFRAWSPQYDRALILRGRKPICVTSATPIHVRGLSFPAKIERLCRKVQREKRLPADLQVR